ncbi:MAG: response regulator [Bacteroidales bacterium]|nr:response regulator [Bacteroidales bacterium]
MTGQFRKYLKRNSIQLKIGLLMIAAVILLSATSFLLYRNLSSIVSSIRIDVNPELRLLSIRDISMDLEKAGNSVRIYTITKDPADIKPYYDIISNIDEKVSRFRYECRNDSSLLVQADTISRLIEDNIFIWNELLILYKDNRVIDYLTQLSDELNTAATAADQKRGILKRVFSRDKKKPTEEKEIVEDINEVVRQTSTTRDELAQQESQLAVNSSIITAKFYDLITKMENEVFEQIRAKGDAADEIAEKTYRLLVMLSISGGLLAILVLYIIIRYARNAYAYQLALEKSKDEAEKLSRTRELFMANMSHEIRTPVTAISGFTEQLLHEPLNENLNGSLRIIKSSSDHLLRIIDDILDFSKLQNNKLTLEKVHFSIGRLVDEVYALFEKQALSNNTLLSFSLSEDTPPVLLGDPFRLKQIMINLVSNSVKFTRNGNVHFSVGSVGKKEGEIDLLMEFTDTGIGIDESKIDIIFEDFTQAEMSTTRKYGGTGLGLSIVKRLVELHQGTIDFRSRKNQGTKIICRLPYLKGDEREVTKEMPSALSIPDPILGMRFLIVDDEEYNRLLFKKILNRWKIRFTVSVSGVEALELLKEEKYDLLFMDMRMPGIDGFKTARFIRDEMDIKESDMPIVIVSAAPLSDEWQKYRKAGVNAFLQKPFTEEKLLTTILNVMGDHTRVTLSGEDEMSQEISAGTDKINLKNLIHIAGNDEQFVNQMLASFITSSEKLLDEMQEAAREKRWESLSDLSHKMIPPCRHIGAMDLCSLLSDIEKSARENDPPGSLETMVTKAMEEFIIVKKLLNDHIDKTN